MAEVPDFLTVNEAGRVLRIGRTMAYQLAQEWIATGGERGIPCRRVGRLLRVPSAQLAVYMGGPITWPPPAVEEAPMPARPDWPAPRSPRSTPTAPRSSRRAAQQTPLPYR